MNPFATYDIINAEDIVTGNIRPGQIYEDTGTLINALTPVTYITKPELQRASCLHSNVIQKLATKPCTLDLLKHFGYIRNDKGEFIYKQTNAQREITAREDAAKEFQRFYTDLRRAKDGILDGFEEFVQKSQERPSGRPSGRPYSSDTRAESPRRLRPQASSPLQSSQPLPNHSKVREGNEKTSETINLFKQDILTKFGEPPVHSFIRRKLAVILFKQKYPDSIDFGDQCIDEDIDQRIRRLREKDKVTNAARDDEIYTDCLIRADFHEEAAYEILRHHRPNLKPPPEEVNARGPTNTTIANSVRRIQQHWGALNQDAAANGAAQVLVLEGDEWKNAVHVIRAIIELRNQSKNQINNQIVVSKVHRLIYSELSRIVRQQFHVKIELIAFALCEIPPEALEHLDMSDIKNILRSCGDFEVNENFGTNAKKSLSVECPLCSSSYPRSRMETMFFCNHMCCLDCVKGYYRNAIKDIGDPKTLGKLTCFDNPEEISDDTKLNFFQWLGSKLNQWFTDERLVLELYHENLFIATREPQTRKCGNPRCVGFVHADDNNRVARAQCPHCQFYQCQQCCRKWNPEHSKMACEAYGDWLKDNDPDDPEVQLLKYLNTAGMACPNPECDAVFEYQAGGCEHFTCRQCHTEFCRICSALFYNPAKNTRCPRPSCSLKNALHAHCCLNCFREIRDAQVDEIFKLLTDHKVNVTEELKLKPAATNHGCPVDGCKNAASVTCENKFCEPCYKQFLCLLVWRNEIEPWELYQDNNLRQKLLTSGVTAPANATRAVLIGLAKQHLTGLLGKPKKISRTRK